MFIAITDATGVGKTTLASRLAARLEATLRLDPFADTPTFHSSTPTPNELPMIWL
ncbi:hypothetical protein ACIOBK_02135 [Micromonospora chokoriensis]